MFIGDQTTFGQSSSNRESHGQASNSNSTSFVFQKSVSNTNPFAIPSTGCMQGGSQAPSSAQSIFSASSALGSSASSTSTASFSAFGGNPSFSSGSSLFNNNSGSLFQQAQSSSANQISGASNIFGPSTQSTFANIDPPLPSICNSVTPLSGFTGCPIFGSPPHLTAFAFGKSDGHESLNSKPKFVHTNSAIGTNGELGTSSFSSGSSFFNNNSGSLFQQTQSSSGNQISGSSSVFGPSTQPRFGNYGLPSFSAFKFEKSDGHESLNSKPIFGQPNSATGTNKELGTRSYTSVPRDMTSMFSNKEFGPSPIQSQWQGSRVSPYAATTEEWNNFTTPTAAKIISISATPAYERKSHEELKFEDYRLTRGYCIAENQFEAGLSTSTTRNLASGATSEFSSGMNYIISINLQFPEPSVGTENAFSESSLAQNQPDMLRRTSTVLGLQPGMAPLSETDFKFTSNSTHNSISNQPPADPSTGTGSKKINIQESAARSNLTIGWSNVTHPFEEPTVQISVDCPTSNTTIQHGISSLSINDSPTIERRSLLTVRCRSLNRNRPTVEKYKPERDHKKVPFFDEGLPDACKFKAPFIPRQNPRAWLLHPSKEQSTEKTSISSVPEDKSTGIHDTGIYEASKGKDGGSSQFHLSLNGIFHDDCSQEGKTNIISQGHQADEDTTVYANVADVQRLMPKLQCPEYYTIPSIDELAAKEKNEPGFCRHVKDFVLGRYSYGSIKFLGETDVTNLDLESIVKFNYLEMIVYMDETTKPPVGQGLNKPAEVSLLNIKCIDKNTGRQQVDGPMVDMYRQKLIKKGAEQGFEFVSYDPASGEWKFRVQHF